MDNVSTALINLIGTVPDEYMFLVYIFSSFVVLYFIYSFFGIVNSLFKWIGKY